MKALLSAATGMVGQGPLRECLLDPPVEHVLSIVRNTTGRRSAKLSELAHKDFFGFSPGRISARRLRFLLPLRRPLSGSFPNTSLPPKFSAGP
jgi:hypothetical protein